MTARQILVAPQDDAPGPGQPDAGQPGPSEPGRSELGPSEPGTSRFERKRESVLAAAAQIFNRDGVRGATLSDVAAAVDLNIKSLRYYFTRKDDLAATAFMRAIEVYASLIDQASGARTAEARVRTFIRLYFGLVRDVVTQKVPPFLHFGDLRSLGEPQAGPVFAAFNEMFRALRRMIATPALETAGWAVLNARTHLVLSQVLWSVVWVHAYEAEDLARAGERMADILLHGLAPDAGAWTPRGSYLETTRPDRIGASQHAFLRAATILINDQGYKGASIDRIAASLNVTKGAFYHYHDAKDDLVVACFERTFQMMRRAQAISQTTQDGFGRVTDAACLLAHHQLTEDGPLLRTSALTALPERIRTEMTRRLDRVTSRFADAITDGMIDGSIRPCDAAIAAQMVTGAINSAEELPRWVRSVVADDVIALYVQPSFMGLYC